jgi:hypothetical protein
VRVWPFLLEPELEDDAALRDGAIAEVLEQASEETIEHEHLSEATHAGGAGGRAHAFSSACLNASGFA